MTDKVLEYNGNRITFQIGDHNVMVNATEMAKPFNKQPAFWLRTKQAKEYISEYIGMQNCIPSDIVRIINGDNGGTLFHEDIAMEFARWLSPKFGIWCNDRLKELMKYGFTATDEMLDTLLANPDLSEKLFSRLKEEREKHALALQNEKEISEIWWEDARISNQCMLEAFDSSNFYRMKAKRYFNLTMEYLKLLKMNNVKIPSNLKLYRINYAKDLLHLRN